MFAGTVRPSARQYVRPGRCAQALCLPRPVAGAKEGAVLASRGTLARPVQCRVRCAGLRPHEHVLRGKRPICPRAPGDATAAAATSGPIVRRWGSLGGHARGLATLPTRCCPARLPTAKRCKAQGGWVMERIRPDGPGRDAQQRSADAVDRRHAQATLGSSGERPVGQAVAVGPATGLVQVAGRRGRLYILAQSLDRVTKARAMCRPVS